MRKRIFNVNYIQFVIYLFTVLIFSVLPVLAQLSPAQQDAIDKVEELGPELREVATFIWENPEISTDEFLSAGRLIDYLEKYGFVVEEEVVEGLPTSFVGTYGSGKPVVGILAEFDALPGLSQKSGVFAQKDPVIEGAPGQGCGHHIYGAASATAAIALAKTMEEHGITGTVKLFGCLAEEGYSGKAWMVAAGLFDDVDFRWSGILGMVPAGLIIVQILQELVL